MREERLPEPSLEEEVSADDIVLERWNRACSLRGETSRHAVLELCGLLGDADASVRWAAAEALATTARQLADNAHSGPRTWSQDDGTYSNRELLRVLDAGLSCDSVPYREAIADMLGLWRHDVAYSRLVGALSDSDATVRAAAARGLGELADGSLVGDLSDALDDPSLWVRRAAAESLGNTGSPKALGALRRAAADPEAAVRGAVVCALGHVPGGLAEATVRTAAQDPAPEVRWFVARSARTSRDRGALAALQALRGDRALVLGRTVGEVAASALAPTGTGRTRAAPSLQRSGSRLLKRLLRRGESGR